MSATKFHYHFSISSLFLHKNFEISTSLSVIWRMTNRLMIDYSVKLINFINFHYTKEGLFLNKYVHTLLLDDIQFGCTNFLY